MPHLPHTIGRTKHLRPANKIYIGPRRKTDSRPDNRQDNRQDIRPGMGPSIEPDIRQTNQHTHSTVQTLRRRLIPRSPKEKPPCASAT